MLNRVVVAIILACCCVATVIGDIEVPDNSFQPESELNGNSDDSQDWVEMPQVVLGSNSDEEVSFKEQDKITESRSLSKNKRAKRNLIIPGTNWCGVGNVSRDNAEVGDIAGTDKCCRQHDYCPFTIEGFSTKYNMFNYRFHTLSHCECDDIFRTCLRMASSDQANLIGELYFNIIGMKCFAFRRETVCAERTWWGKCERERTQSVAEMRDPLQY